MTVSENREPEDDVSLKNDGVFSIRQELRGLVTRSGTCKQMGLPNVELETKLRGCHCEFMTHKLTELKETTISTFIYCSYRYCHTLMMCIKDVTVHIGDHGEIFLFDVAERLATEVIMGYDFWNEHIKAIRPRK